ncbi:hypothetical protein ACFLUX_01490 [Chloroflexota bacterium]
MKSPVSQYGTDALQSLLADRPCTWSLARNRYILAWLPNSGTRYSGYSYP